MTNQDIYSTDNKPLVTKIYKSNEEETKCSNRLTTSMCDQYFSSNTNQRVSKEGDNILSKAGESKTTALTGKKTLIMHQRILKKILHEILKFC